MSNPTCLYIKETCMCGISLDKRDLYVWYQPGFLLHIGVCLLWFVTLLLSVDPFVKRSIYLFFLYIVTQVCKYFLEVVEKKQYGWFWSCPNGGKDCHYRHALPPGYVLKSQMKALLEEEADKIPIEEEIENQVMVILVLISFYIVSHLFKFILASYRWFFLSFYYCSCATCEACKINGLNSNDSWAVYTMEDEEGRRKRGWLGRKTSRKS